ncbi:hypothetical protein [Paenisporosarcina sp. OV554]|uniref:hypothetical protein n=1 Tax=Paenisporosarcina sp. OV554 TaxID=2135694 RepID=UPI000D3C1D94|nr:hypothetical protein [Paenisporosarcina sp. OV554]PUB16774.1 hypothetical protein C8K15_102204 [Paenisporosarcina sp. OV554]
MNILRIIGIALIVMVGLGFLLVPVIPNFIIHSIVLSIIVYSLVGILSLKSDFPYYMGYMASFCLVTLNQLFYHFILNVPVLFDPVTIFSSYLPALLIVLITVFIGDRLLSKKEVVGYERGGVSL